MEITVELETLLSANTPQSKSVFELRFMLSIPVNNPAVMKPIMNPTIIIPNPKENRSVILTPNVFQMLS